ncbi:MAG: bacillithiol biosynthesis cysteine-adding enzyme BshC [Saprospiraceae bacterium]|nr:bacillithiol biosynthesis cysteine-adding enzyme BshC [Saprospiraceae bacterium]
MKVIKIPYSEVEQFSATDVAYANLDKDLLKFAKYEPNLESFEQVLADKAQDLTDRDLLADVLRKQYATYITDTVLAEGQINLLADERTFTIVTAHQPVLFTGPAYLAYKIISAVKLTRSLKEKHTDFNFIPVFVTGGEDHDFDEMDHANLYGKTIQWKNEESGSVGRMSTKSLDEALQSLKDILGDSPSARECFDVFEKTHTHHRSYGRAFCDLINGLFGSLGIVVLNMDEPRFKEKMKNIFKDEILSHHSADYVRSTQKEMENAGFGPQAYARDINLFYLDKGMRNRIEKVGQSYQIVDTTLSFSEKEILEMIEKEPERFSPNVVVRPLFQEKILPNLAYVGGGGELAYWLERKNQFEFFGINFPVLVRRDSCLWVDKGTLKKMQKLELDVSDFFKPEVEQIREFVSRNAEHEFSLQDEKGKLELLWSIIENKAAAIDPTLKGAAAAEGKNQIKSLEKIEDRLRRAEKQKHEVALGQIRNIREKLYPGGGLQERTSNFLEFYLRNPDNYFQTLLDAFDPLDMHLKVLVDD